MSRRRMCLTATPTTTHRCYEEADEMLQVALLIYTMTDLRTLAKKKKTTLVNPELVLTLPLRYVLVFQREGGASHL